MDTTSEPLGTGARSFTIPAARFGYLQSKFDELNRKARRLGVDPVGLRLLEERTVIIKASDPREADEIQVWNDVLVWGGCPKLPGGWTFVGTVQHTTEGNILRKAPGVEFELPPALRSCAPTCDHCHTIRNRIDTYVLRDESGDLKHVGSNCLTAYLGGASADSIAARCQFFAAVGGAIEFAEGGSARSTSHYTLAEIMARVVAALRYSGRGFLTRKAADEVNLDSTSYTVGFGLSQLPVRCSDSVRARWRELQPTESERAEGEAIVARARALIEAAGAPETLSDFDNNLRVILSLDTVTDRELGLACYVFEWVRRKEATALERNRAALTFEWEGKVGERLRNVKLVCERAVELPDYGYGPSAILIFSNDRGNLFVWKTGAAHFNPGQHVVLTGTVKDHTEYHGRKQTVLTRCKVQ